MSPPSLGDGFALFKALYDLGYGVEFMACRDEDAMSVCIPFPGIHEMPASKSAAPWRVLVATAAAHSVIPFLDLDAISFAAPEVAAREELQPRATT